MLYTGTIQADRRKAARAPGGKPGSVGWAGGQPPQQPPPLPYGQGGAAGPGGGGGGGGMGAPGSAPQTALERATHKLMTMAVTGERRHHCSQGSSPSTKILGAAWAGSRHVERVSAGLSSRPLSPCLNAVTAHDTAPDCLLPYPPSPRAPGLKGLRPGPRPRPAPPRPMAITPSPSLPFFPFLYPRAPGLKGLRPGPATHILLCGLASLATEPSALRFMVRHGLVDAGERAPVAAGMRATVSV